MSLPSEAPRRHVRVAIVGSGLTGLVATYLLTASQPHAPDAPRISVDIFERAPTLGMDSASITVPLPPPPPPQPEAAPPRLVKRARLDANSNRAKDVATSMRIDVPMRAFTGGYYPQLLALYRHLGIRARKTNFTYSFARFTDASFKGERNAPEPSLLYNGANGVRGISLPASLMRMESEGIVRVSAVLQCVRRLRVYFGSLVVMVLGYVQLLIIALWHSMLGHTADANHPLRTHTLRDLVRDPFPRRSPRTSSSKLRYGAERLAEAVLRRVARLDERFVEQTLAPLFSAVMTCSLDAVWASPATEVLDYIALTLGRDHFVVQDGVRTVVRALLVHVAPGGEEESRVWTRAQVCRMHHRNGRAWLSVMHHAEGTEMSREPSSSSASTGTDATCIEDAREHGPYDHIIFATQANQTARFLEAYAASLDDEAERGRVGSVVEALRTVRYERSVVVNHTDRTLLPVNRRDWRDLNLVSPAASCETGLRRRGSAGSDWTDSSSDSSDTEAGQEGHTMATHVLRVPSYAPVVMQTTNPHPSLEPSQESVLSRAAFERAVLDVRAHVARQTLFTRSNRHSPNADAVDTAGGTQLQLGPLQPVRAATDHAQVWVAGSWASGIPLLEGCVVSATLVAKSIVRAEGASLPSSAAW
ncbi:hypothetical protein L1887_59046 [Cichorium endivia]|nr:hypothetical protein L1887_59046 [Cichorium endivia]